MKSHDGAIINGIFLWDKHQNTRMVCIYIYMYCNSQQIENHLNTVGVDYMVLSFVRWQDVLYCELTTLKG